jgi:hypothetical protein
LSAYTLPLSASLAIILLGHFDWLHVASFSIPLWLTAVYCCCPVEDQLNCCIFPLTDGSAAPHVLLIFALFAAAAILPVVQRQHQLLVTLLLCNAVAMEVEYLDYNHINYHTILYSRSVFIC